MIPDLYRVDWNELTTEQLKEIESELLSELSDKERCGSEMRLYGKLVLFRAKHLSLRYNREILTVLSKWLNDPGMLERHRIVDDRVYDWAALKRDQRRYDRYIQAQRLKEYWAARKRKQRFFEQLNEAINTKTAATKFDTTYLSGTDDGFMTAFLSPFTPEAEEKRELGAVFDRLKDVHPIDRLPLRELIINDLRPGPQDNAKLFSALPQYTENDKRDVVAKFSALLQLEKDGAVTIHQDEPFQDPQLTLEAETEPIISMKSRSGRSATMDLSDLSEPHKLLIINQIKTGELICV